jgi:hypothetical protein
MAKMDTIITPDQTIKLYADSINNLNLAGNFIPNFLSDPCIENHPPFFPGFHASARWQILQEVNNIKALEYLLDKNKKIGSHLSVKCTVGKNVKKVYGDLSFYELVRMRYDELRMEQKK